LLSDRERLRTMAKTGRQKSQQTYCATKVIPRYEEFYESLLRHS
jgi:hypothetical protein